MSLLSPYSLKAQSTIKIAFKKRDWKKKTTIFSQESSQASAKNKSLAPASAESKRGAPEENSFSDNLMGKGPVKARSLSITTIIIIVGSSCRRLRGTGSQDSLSQAFRGSSQRCEVTARQPGLLAVAFVRPRGGCKKCEGEKQILPGKGRALPEKPHSFELKKNTPHVASPGERNQTGHSLPAQPENDGARVGLHLAESRTKNTHPYTGSKSKDVVGSQRETR